MSAWKERMEGKSQHDQCPQQAHIKQEQNTESSFAGASVYEMIIIHNYWVQMIGHTHLCPLFPHLPLCRKLSV